ncbi:MAG: SDR family oxidoreductase [Nitrospira sp.]|nr:SDR family oxidoreductase [Nitrospira sp.]
MKPLVVVTGAGGLIGQYVVRTVVRWAPDWKVRGLTRRDLELTEFPAVEAMWRTLNPSAVIHCAALSRTKDCEQDPTAARLANVRVTAHLAALACDIPFIFLSSGEVFDGRKGWYDESDEPVPINVYGRTKLEAEQVVLRNPRHSVVRIVLTAGTSVSGDRSFVEDMCRAARAGKDLRLYADEFRCPLPAGVIARALWDLLHAGRPGLYHLGGAERLSRWEIGELLLPRYPVLAGRLIRGSGRDHVGAPRPADLSLRCDKIQTLLSFQLPGLAQWLRQRGSDGDPWDYPAS